MYLHPRHALIIQREANNTLEAVDEVSDKLQRNIGIIRTRIQDHFDKLRSVMRKREIILLGFITFLQNHPNTQV